MSDQARLTIHPEPDREELSAILVTLRAARSRESGDTASQTSAWTIAARRETLRCGADPVRSGWQRTARFGE